jgi:hypothetical protein
MPGIGSVGLAWYKSGTANLINGSTTVTGVDTQWLTAGVKTGDPFTVDDTRNYEIASVTNNTTLTLVKPFQGASGNAQSYAIVRNWAATMTAELAAKVAELLSKYEAFIDADLSKIIGPKGEPGWVYKSAWAAGRSYNAMDIVVYNSALYIALLAHTSATGNAPPSNATWMGMGVSLPSATETTPGLVQLATPAEAQAGTNDKKGMTPATVNILIKDSLRASVEAASGGKVTILYDDQGNPSYMRRFAPMTIKNLYRQYYASDDAWNERVFKEIEKQAHPAFYKPGTLIKELLVGQYLACEVNGRACSLPGMGPLNNLNYDNALAACKNKGAGWTMGTMHIWGFLQALCLRQGYQPRGNTHNGESYEAPWETALSSNAKAAIVGASAFARTKTGTGPAAWNHDGTETGVADLVGNLQELQTLMKLVDGKVMLAPDNDIDLPEAGWPDIGMRYDSTGGTPDGTEITVPGNGDVGNPIVSDEILKYTGVPGQESGGGSASVWSATGFSGMAKKAGYTPPVAAILAGLAPVTHVGGAYESGMAPLGEGGMKNYGTRFATRGGDSSRSITSGIGALLLTSLRTTTGSGFRPAFLLV